MDSVFEKMDSVSGKNGFSVWKKWIQGLEKMDSGSENMDSVSSQFSKNSDITILFLQSDKMIEMTCIILWLAG